jgi:hypothetical protein
MINNDHLLEVQYATQGMPVEYVGVIPFQDEITSEEPLVGVNYIPYGSTKFTRLAHERGFVGNCFNENMNYRTFLENRDDMLNNGVFKLDEAIEYLSQVSGDRMFFTRPNKDLKEFVGMVERADKLIEWFQNAQITESSVCVQFNKDIEVVLSEPRDIQAEYRWFVVGGKVISGSMYKYKDRLHKVRVTEIEAIDEAQAFADKWLPHDTCCMDLCLVDDEVKVVEFNCINSCGFYDNDVQAIFKALWERFND